jgi:hypothetical protein
MKKLIIACFFGSLILASCQDENFKGTNPTNPGSFSATINGEDWIGQPSTFNHSFTNDPVFGQQLILRAKSSDGRSVVVSVYGIKPGTYKWDFDKGISESIVSLSIPGKTDPITKLATVTITVHDVAKKEVSGTFTFETENQEYVGINGNFTELVYKLN